MQRGKNKQVTITVNEKELVALENRLLCWGLCQKHKEKSLDMSEKDIAAAAATCPDCIKIERKWHKDAWRVCSRLWDEYEKATKQK